MFYKDTGHWFALASEVYIGGIGIIKLVKREERNGHECLLWRAGFLIFYLSIEFLLESITTGASRLMPTLEVLIFFILVSSLETKLKGLGRKGLHREEKLESDSLGVVHVVLEFGNSANPRREWEQDIYGYKNFRPGDSLGVVHAVVEFGAGANRSREWEHDVYGYKNFLPGDSLEVVHTVVDFGAGANPRRGVSGSNSMQGLSGANLDQSLVLQFVGVVAVSEFVDGATSRKEWKVKRRR
ncbi:hypothetical protein LguiB_020474 [Lonicera macranthoides]